MIYAGAMSQCKIGRGRVRRTLLAAAAILMPACVQADAPVSPVTGMELYNWCTSNDGEIETACRVYLAGVTEGFTLGQQLQQYGIILCLPDGVTPPQMQLMLLKVARDHPELLNMPAATIASKAILDTYKCHPGQSPVYGQTPK